ncbi:hypothetical protein [Priestia abyssalis]|uniref:hypothetical protein n=1 Tax=Priestia abyssalis TaxID=1221450 RepID=UPI000994A371|nr:hypothetical protein [Priestia abyssalis]
MKQTFSVLFLIMLLVGCSANAAPDSDETNKENATETERPTNEKNTETSKQKDSEQTENQTVEYQPNPQVTDDRSLLEVGQSYEDDKGEATLKAINNVNQTYKVGPIELTVKEMKLVHLRPSYGMIDYFHVLTHEEEFDFVKVFVEIKNTSSEKVNFAPVALLETNTGETFDWEKDIYLEELNGEIQGNAVKTGNIGFIVNATDGHAHKEQHDEHAGGDSEKDEHDNEAKNVKWIEITTSDVFDQTENKISESQKIKIEF